MFSVFINIQNKLKTKLENFTQDSIQSSITSTVTDTSIAADTSAATDTNKATNTSAATNNTTPLYEGFKHPITYLDASCLHPLSPIVSTDLELLESSNTPIYEYLFKPKHKFAKDMIKEWNKYYTTNIDYLNDTKTVLHNIPEYIKNVSDKQPFLDCDKFTELWTDLKEDEDFLSRYNYMEWEILENFNTSSSFLQALSLLHIVTPVINLVLPFFLLIMPLIIMRIQGVDINYETYLTILKEVASNHIIGKALGMGSLSADRIFYILLTMFLYFFQIYQNIVQCHRFYRNMEKINRHLYYLREHCEYSIQSMESFIRCNSNCASYSEFFKDVQKNVDHLKEIHGHLAGLTPFSLSFSKLSQLGNLLKLYYEIYSIQSYEAALRFSVGFEGYMNNMIGVFENISDGIISYGDFDICGNCVLKEQFYPVLMKENPVKNDCQFKKNMVLTGVNASGKTTLLKTTTINIIFTQQLGCGFYKSCKLNPYTHIHSYLNIPDTSGRDSLFQAESRRCKEIIDIVCKFSDTSKYRHFCIFDELYSGTNPFDATKSAYAFLLYLSKYKNVNFILTTHYVGLCKKLKLAKSAMICYKMSTEIGEDGAIKYTYRLNKGISREQGAIKVLQQLDYPIEIIDKIRNY
uniref:DNA mismatch repair proteins mutS family domain-containing protein n=1 Tax=viral metagenome TaxID=1070528 RepID=A0A6C0DSH0_9ZZZZ